MMLVVAHTVRDWPVSRSKGDFYGLGGTVSPPPGPISPPPQAGYTGQMLAHKTGDTQRLEGTHNGS